MPRIYVEGITKSVVLVTIANIPIVTAMELSMRFPSNCFVLITPQDIKTKKPFRMSC